MQNETAENNFNAFYLNPNISEIFQRVIDIKISETFYRLGTDLEVHTFAARLWFGPATRRVLDICVGRALPRRAFWHKCLPCSFSGVVFSL